MKFTKKIALLIMVVAMLVMSGCGQAKIGYIDGEKVMKEAPQIADVVNEGNTKIKEAQQAAEDDLKQKQAAGASQEDVQKSQQDAQRKVMALNQQYSTLLKQKLDVALGEIAKNKKLDVVIDNAEQQKTVLNGGIDVTDEVIQKLQ